MSKTIGRWNYTLVKEYIENLGYKLLDNEYKNVALKLTLCDNEGFYYYISLNNLQNYQPSKFNKYNPYTIQNIELWCKINNKPFKLISKYFVEAKSDLIWVCLKDSCEEIFKMSWDHILRNYGCPFCRGLRVGKSNCLATKRSDISLEWHPTLNSDLTPFDVTCGSDKEVWWQCLDNPKHNWCVKISSRTSKNSGCPYCPKPIGNVLPSEDYNLLVCNPQLASEWNYDKNIILPLDYTPNSGKYVWWICKKCGNEWFAEIQSRNKGSGCPKCNQSHGENSIEKVLSNKNIIFIPQHIFSNCKNKNSLRFDFYLPNYNICIEYQGIQHYESVEHFGGETQFKLQQKLDQIKRDYCKNNNIPLLRIPYWDFDNIEPILTDFLNQLNLNIKVS